MNSVEDKLGVLSSDWHCVKLIKMDTKQEYKYKNFTYLLDGQNQEVITDFEQPNSLYKYYYNNNNNIDAIKNGYLFATHPYKFNDSIDSSELLINFENITLERYIGFYKRFLPNEEFLKYDFDKLFTSDKANSFSSIRLFFYEYFSRKFGLISLTTQPTNILMWSHYSSESGFIIELDKKCLINNLRKHTPDIKNYCFRPVQYVKELESIDMFKEGFTSPDVPFLYMTTVKRKEWEYEEEWRLTVFKTDMGIPYGDFSPGTNDYVGTEERKVYYSKDCIKSIVLGKHFFNGKNCSKINPDLSYEIRDENFLTLVNYLFESQNDKLHISGELQKDTKFGRSIDKIEILKLNELTFKINYLE